MRLRVMRWSVGVDSECVLGWVRGAAVVALVGGEEVGLAESVVASVGEDWDEEETCQDRFIATFMSSRR